MRYTKETIKKGVYLHGGDCPGYVADGNITKGCPTAQPPAPTLQQIGERIKAATVKAEAALKQLQKRT